MKTKLKETAFERSGFGFTIKTCVDPIYTKTMGIAEVYVLLLFLFCFCFFTLFKLGFYFSHGFVFHNHQIFS